MDTPALLHALGPLVAPLLEESFHRRDLCILATRCAIEALRAVGVDAGPLPVVAMVYNRQFAAHVADGSAATCDDCRKWNDGSWGVGIGFGEPEFNRWPGHLIVAAGDWFGDYAIGQAERLQHGIVTGPAVVGPRRGAQKWEAVEAVSGTVVEYRATGDTAYRQAPDWKDASRRRPIVGKLVRALRAAGHTDVTQA